MKETKAYKKCKNCPEYKYCRDSLFSWILFIIALIATIAMRIIEPLNIIDSLYGKLAWYIGVTGFFIFFLYKFVIDHKRQKKIKKSRIFSKIRHHKQLSKEDYSLLDAIFCSLISRKDKLNFFFIATFSILALIIALYFDVFGG